MPAHLLNISYAGVRRTSAPKEKKKKKGISVKKFPGIK
jgi:hypothetical protein